MAKIDFPNYGYLIQDLSDNLFRDLKDECLGSLEEHETHISGLTNQGEGVASHIYLKYSDKSYFDFIYNMMNDYDKEFNYLKQFTILSDARPFTADAPWINYQSENEYLPNHMHGGLMSYTIWIKVPVLSKFQFTYNTTCLNLHNHDLNIDSSFEGKIMMFPSNLYHCVYPFYNSKEKRVSISGNIRFKV